MWFVEGKGKDDQPDICGCQYIKKECIHNIYNFKGYVYTILFFYKGPVPAQPEKYYNKCIAHAILEVKIDKWLISYDNR